MAYAALVSLAQTIEQILCHGDRRSTLLHEKEQIKSLHKRLIFLQDFFEDIPDQLANNLEGRVRDIAYEAEDIIENFMLQQFRSYYISNPFNSFSVIFHRHHSNSELYSYNFKQLFQELQKVTHEIDMIAVEVMETKNSLRTGLVNDFSNASSSPKAHTGKDVMVGFDDDLLAIKARLCGELPKLQVIPIFGMGGIGKTTLAINAYDDPLIVDYFQIRAWVTVSQHCSAQQIISGLVVTLKSLMKESTSKNEALVVYQSLEGRRYLIVLDDMWSTKVWDEVRMLFPDDNNGSRIMLTTRLSDVATYPTDTLSPIYEMQFMDVDQSWNMLRQKVFKQEQCPPELEKIGRMIGSSCRGLPLAIVVISGILSTVSQTRDSWNNVAKNVTSAVTTNNEQFAKILSMSYMHLPRHLRPCFLYMGCFPEDYEIKVSKLIKLWVAEGFLKPSESLSCEEVGEQYLGDLVKRSLVLVTSRKSNGKLKSCNVHDLIRELCIRRAQEEKFLLNAKKFLAERIKNDRRVSINRSRRASVPYIYGPTIRTILCFPPWHDMLNSLEEFRFLRVLDAVRLTFGDFPNEVLELFLLRYLAFSIYRDTIFFVIPPSISKLQCLQTLFIFSSKTKTGQIKCGIDLPIEIWTMAQLRHLSLLAINTSHPHLTSFILENLQTLTLVKNYQCSIRMLESTPNLRKLEIVYSGDRIRWSDFQLNNLVHLDQLESLSIDVEKHRTNPVPLWGNLAFPKRLKKFKLRGFHFSLQDMAIFGSLPNLHEVLKLRDCFYEGRKWETNEGEFSQLKFLCIISTNLQHWITESSHFPCLERLMLCYCGNLEQIPDGITEIPTLDLIEVHVHDGALVNSAKSIKEEQQSLGNGFQVRVMNYYYDD